MIDPKTLHNMVYERVSDWYDANNNTYPDAILYYRDGVSDSQYLAVLQDELPHIRTGFASFCGKKEKERLGKPKKGAAKHTTPSVKLTAVIVTKRHHTRFYPAHPKDKQKGNLNCKPGTLVERSVTSPYFTDFYLQSHNSILGTAKPAHYWVLLDEMQMETSELQHLVRNFPLFPQTPNIRTNKPRRPTTSATPTSAPQWAYPTPHPPTTPTAYASAPAATCATSWPRRTPRALSSMPAGAA